MSGRSGLGRFQELRLRATDAATTYLRQIVPTLAASYTLQWPAALPGSLQAFATDSTGVIQFITANAGTVTSVPAPTVPTDLFTASVSNGTTVPAITLSKVSQSANLFYGSPNGSAGVPSFRSLVSADIPQTLTSTWITNFNSAVQANTLNSLAAPTGSVAMNSQKITGLLDPTAPQDAATKNYVDATAQGLDVKTSVVVASTANVTIASAPAAIDGVTLSATNRILLKNQTTGSENGIYVFNGTGSALTRATDAASGTNFNSGAFTFVEQGTVNGNTGWVLTTSGPITIGTTPLAFTQFSGAGTYLGTSNQITLIGNVFSISTGYVGQTSITTVGTIGTGVWNGASISVANGGTGATTAAAARTNLSAAGTFRGTFTSSTGSTGIAVASNVLTITHNLGATPVWYAIADPNGKLIDADDITYTSTNVLTLDMSVITIAAGTYSLLVLG